MTNSITENRLISHSHTPSEINELLQLKSEIITSQGDKPDYSVQEQLNILNQLAQFPLGRFLLQNRGIDGFWTHYILTYPWEKPKIPNIIEKFLLEKAPIFLATQERFQIFLRENQKSIKEATRLGSIPCGLMGELLYLSFSNIEDIELIGIDYDPLSLKKAKELANQRGSIKYCSFLQSDAWNLNFQNEFDLISSNGLNIYEPDNDKVIALYQQFYNALKSGGKLVTSFVTPPPALTESCEWNLNAINQEDLLLQRMIFSDILDIKWQCFRSTSQTKKQLETVGFVNINFIPDKANMFPTVTAIKT